MWILNDENFSAVTRPSKEAIFSLGNGYFGVRGFFEEEQTGILSLGGIYMAGIFGHGKRDSWTGKNREIVNLPNFLAVKILCDGEVVTQDDVTDYSRTLDIQNGILKRSYVWKNKLKLEFERFVSVTDIHTVCQRIIFTPLTDVEISVDDTMNTDTTNLNYISCEPLPIQPGDKRYSVLEKTADTATVITDGVVRHKIYLKQFTDFSENVFTRRVFAYTTRDCENPEAEFPCAPLGYEEYKERHMEEWKKRWEMSDIKVEKVPQDQLALRYNIFQLMQAAPNNDPRISIGARGLTGEMYEGCIFWDTEIFQLPYFIFTQPKIAKNLLQFRYHTLPEAKKHAKDLWFEGAKFPWQSCDLGYEHTPVNGGGTYAVHVVSDISYGLMQYFNATNDIEFMKDCGLELLIETSRFWASRVVKRYDGAYDLLATKGPNEYDDRVNNNCYTNMMVQENIASAIKMLQLFEEKYPDALAEIASKTELREEEKAIWDSIAKNIVICYDAEQKLYLEDEMYARRTFLDMKKAKPTAKRIMDSTLPIEALTMYQVTKQADVICLMNNLPLRFTDEEKKAAWDYYEPRTAHDSSLSYCSYAIMAARIGLKEYAYKYFKTCAYLDIVDEKLNGISGLHFANLGGTWQIVVYGFAGLSMDGDTIIFDPHIPEEWGEITFKVAFKGNILKVVAKGDTASVSIEKASENQIQILMME